MASWDLGGAESTPSFRQLSSFKIRARSGYHARMSWQRYRVLRQIHARPRLMMATAVALAVGFLLPPSLAGHSVARWLVAWNAGTLLYVLLSAVMMIRSTR